MSDKVAETKETTPVAASPEKKEVVCERKPKEAAKEEESINGKEHKEKLNGAAKDVEEEEEEEEEEENDASENGESEPTDVCPLPQKRKSDVGNGSPKASAAKDGASPEKKAKLEEKVENGAAEATA